MTSLHVFIAIVFGVLIAAYSYATGPPLLRLGGMAALLVMMLALTVMARREE